MGNLKESEAESRRSIELDPSSIGQHVFLSLVYLEQSNPERALAEIQHEDDPAWRLFAQAVIYRRLGKKKDADAALKECIDKYKDDLAYQIALIYSDRGEIDKAFEWLDRAYVQRDGGLSKMIGDPLLRNIIKDPRYKAFLKKMKLPVD
jgi:tetratricopeptide (TPR) repeat protein